MAYYEIIYETGNHSVASYESDEEAAIALGDHHSRAVNGQNATPASTERTDLTDADRARAGQATWPAERIKRVLVYDYHPAEFMAGQELSAKDVKAQVGKILESLEKDGTVSVPQLAAHVRGLTSPIADKEGPHDSQFKMTEARELEASLWENGS